MKERQPDKSKTASSVGVEVLIQALRTLPSSPGVYRFLNTEGKNLYIGKAKNLVKRVQSYTALDRLPHHLKRMVQDVAVVDVTLTHTELEALFLEANLIQKFQPPYNVLLKGRQAHSYLVFTQHPFPLIRGQKSAKGCKAYFGPFLSFEVLRNLLKGLHHAFLLRSCSDKVFAQRTRPCLQYHIKRCSAPCVGYITPEAYAESVEEALEFLKGNSDPVRHQWKHQMQTYSHAEEYEKAAMLRDRLRALDHVQAKQAIHNASLEDADILAAFYTEGVTAIQLFCFRKGANYGAETFFFSHTEAQEEATILTAFIQQFYGDTPVPGILLLSHSLPEEALLVQAFKVQFQKTVKFLYPKRGDKRTIVEHALLNAEKALETRLRTQIGPWNRLCQHFSLSDTPKRVEIYDNSHLRGEYALSAMVVAGPEGFLKAEYRVFSMPQGEDDYAMMRRVMQRRFRWPAQNLPDLLIIDGGKGHLRIVEETLQDLGLEALPMVAIAKGPHRNAGEETLHLKGAAIPVDMTSDGEVLHLLQRLRDEAHRFAIQHHRHKKRRGLLPLK